MIQKSLAVHSTLSIKPQIEIKLKQKLYAQLISYVKKLIRQLLNKNEWNKTKNTKSNEPRKSGIYRHVIGLIDRNRL